MSTIKDWEQKLEARKKKTSAVSAAHPNESQREMKASSYSKPFCVPKSF